MWGLCICFVDLTATDQITHSSKNTCQYISNIFMDCFGLRWLARMLLSKIPLSRNSVQHSKPKETQLLYFRYLSHFIYTTQLRQHVLPEQRFFWVLWKVLVAECQEKKDSPVLIETETQRLPDTVCIFVYFCYYLHWNTCKHVMLPQTHILRSKCYYIAI